MMWLVHQRNRCSSVLHDSERPTHIAASAPVRPGQTVRLTLIESRKPHQWCVRDTIMSLAAHVTFGALLVTTVRQAELPARVGRTATNAQRLLFLKLPRATSKSPGVPRVVSPRRDLTGARPVLSPDQIRTTIERIFAQHATVFELPEPADLGPIAPLGLLDVALDVDAEFTGGSSVAEALRPTRAPIDIASHSGPFDETEVETPVGTLADNPVPRYPGSLEAAGVEGQVLAEFVVDSTGHVERKSVRILSSTHTLFAYAVRDALIRSRFYPALIGNRAVRMRAVQPFWFKVLRR
jgi:TonB family protein